MSEFDKAAARQSANEYWRVHRDYFDSDGVDAGTVFIDGARWQHKQTQARIAVLEKENAQLAAAANDAIKLANFNIDELRLQCKQQVLLESDPGEDYLQCKQERDELRVELRRKLDSEIKRADENFILADSARGTLDRLAVLAMKFCICKDNPSVCYVCPELTKIRSEVPRD